MSRLHARLVSEPAVRGGTPLLVSAKGRPVGVLDILDRVKGGDDVGELAEDFEVSPDAIRLLVRLDNELAERHKLLAKRPPRKHRRPTRPVLPQNTGVIADERRRRMVLAAQTLIAESGPKKASLAEIVKKAGVGREMFYRLYPGVDDLIKGALRGAIEDGLRSTEDGGLDGFLVWADENPAALHTALVAGPVICMEAYLDALDRAAALLGPGPAPLAIVHGAARMVVSRISRGEPLDRAVAEELAQFASIFRGDES